MDILQILSLLYLGAGLGISLVNTCALIAHGSFETLSPFEVFLTYLTTLVLWPVVVFDHSNYK
jgi:hypothetical protein